MIVDTFVALDFAKSFAIINLKRGRGWPILKILNDGYPDGPEKNEFRFSVREVELHRPLDLREELAEVPLALRHQLLEPLAPGPRLVRQRQLRVVLPVELNLLKRNELAS